MKPWVYEVEKDATSTTLVAFKNVSSALANLPTETKREMGHTVDEMLKGCMCIVYDASISHRCTMICPDNHLNHELNQSQDSLGRYLFKN